MELRCKHLQLQERALKMRRLLAPLQQIVGTERHAEQVCRDESQLSRFESYDAHDDGIHRSQKPALPMPATDQNC